MAQRRLGVPLSILRGLDYSPCLGRAVDALGDTFLNHSDHSRRHNGVAKVLARAARSALNRKVLGDTFQHEHFSKGARPDAAIIRGAADGLHHNLLEVKVVNPVSSTDATPPEGAFAAFVGEPDLRRKILGCPAVDGRDAVAAKYADALSRGHTVTPCIFEVFGGFSADVCGRPT